METNTANFKLRCSEPLKRVSRGSRGGGLHNKPTNYSITKTSPNCWSIEDDLVLAQWELSPESWALLYLQY